MLADRFGSTLSATARGAYVDASERALTFYPGGLVAMTTPSARTPISPWRMPERRSC
jgi:hypothetical protein